MAAQMLLEGWWPANLCQVNDDITKLGGFEPLLYYRLINAVRGIAVCRQGLQDVCPFIANARIDIVVDVELVSPDLDIVVDEVHRNRGPKLHGDTPVAVACILFEQGLAMRGGAVALQPARQFPGILGEQADTAMARRRANAPGLIGAVQHETGANGHFDIAEGVVFAGRGRFGMLGPRAGGRHPPGIPHNRAQGLHPNLGVR
jgi:hypothetical protein